MTKILRFEGGNAAGEEGNKSETIRNPRPFTRAIRNVVSFCKLRRIVLTFLSLFLAYPVEDALDHIIIQHILYIQVEDALDHIIWTARNRNSQKKIHPTESTCLRLKFSHDIAPMLFTGECIVPKETKLELVDAVTGYPLSHGPLASAEVEFFLHAGDLSGDGANRTTEELNSHIKQERGTKTPTLGKIPRLKLQGGVATVGEIKLKHTPKWMKKLEMRLGARIVDQPQVREAVTGPFIVKDKRLKTKKRYPPSPTDDVWRLEKIGKNGVFHKQLTENGIGTVEDFLIQLYNNPQQLRHILGKSMSNNFWEIVTTHANTCKLDGRKYVYNHLENQQKAAVVFNVAGQVTWFDSGWGLDHFNKLSEPQKAFAHKLVQTAFANWGNVVKFDSESSIIDHLSSSSSSPQLESLSRSDHLGNFVMVDEFQDSEHHHTSLQGTTERNQRVVSAECSTSYDQHMESGHGMSLSTITPPGNSTTGLSPWDNLMDAGNLEEIMKFLANEIQLDGETGQANAETSAWQFGGGEGMENEFIDLMVSENIHFVIHEEGINNDQMCLMKNVSMRKGKSRKGWVKISSVLRWFQLKRLVKLKSIRITKKRKFS